MVTIRYKKLSTGKFSAYLDVYSNTSDGKGKRSYEFLKIYVNKDYSDPSSRVLEADKDKLKVINATRNKREDDLNFSEHGYRAPSKINYNLHDYLDQALAKKFNYKLECLIIHLGKYCPKRTILFQEVDEDLLAHFQTYLQSQVSRNTTNAYMSVFRQHFNKLVVKGIITVSPFGNFKIIEEEDSERTTLTIEEVRMLANYIPKRGTARSGRRFYFRASQGSDFPMLRNWFMKKLETGN
ncbi:MAG TPA: phage integrase SAM-like domain and Arm DNA-binding domain-containing protein [Pedobacter sp.]